MVMQPGCPDGANPQKRASSYNHETYLILLTIWYWFVGNSYLFVSHFSLQVVLQPQWVKVITTHRSCGLQRKETVHLSYPSAQVPLVPSCSLYIHQVPCITLSAVFRACVCCTASCIPKHTPFISMPIGRAATQFGVWQIPKLRKMIAARRFVHCVHRNLITRIEL